MIAAVALLTGARARASATARHYQIFFSQLLVFLCRHEPNWAKARWAGWTNQKCPEGTRSRARERRSPGHGVPSGKCPDNRDRMAQNRVTGMSQTLHHCCDHGLVQAERWKSDARTNCRTRGTIQVSTLVKRLARSQGIGKWERKVI